MLWIIVTSSAVAAIVALAIVLFARRNVDVDELGTVSSRWIADHRVDSR